MMASYSDLLKLELQIETQLGLMEELICVIHMALDCWMGKSLGGLLVFHTYQHTCHTQRKPFLDCTWPEKQTNHHIHHRQWDAFCIRYRIQHHYQVVKCLALITYLELMMASYSDLLHLEMQIETQLGLVKELVYVLHMALDCWMGYSLGGLLVFQTDQHTCFAMCKPFLACTWLEN